MICPCKKWTSQKTGWKHPRSREALLCRMVFQITFPCPAPPQLIYVVTLSPCIYCPLPYFWCSVRLWGWRERHRLCFGFWELTVWGWGRSRRGGVLVGRSFSWLPHTSALRELCLCLSPPWLHINMDTCKWTKSYWPSSQGPHPSGHFHGALGEE